MIYRKKIWTSQPQGPAQINWGNPLTAGLTDWIDLRPLIARSALPTGKNVTSQASAIIKSPGPGGIGLKFPGGTTDGKLSVGSGPDYTQTNQSWVVVCSPRALSDGVNNSNILLSKHDPSGSIKGFTFICDLIGVGAQIKGATTSISNSISLSFDSLKSPVCAFAFSFSPSFFRVAANGKVSTDAASPSFSINVDFPLNIGDSPDSFWNTFDGVIYAVFGWVGTALAPTQLAEVTRNPWQLFAPSTVTVVPQSITYTYARPASDITTQWSTSSGSTHYTLIDETVADDNDYIVATAAGQTDEVKLASMTPPQVGTNLVINYKVTGIDGGATVTASLREGSAGTLIKTDTAKSANGTYALTVAPADWAAVSAWSDLRLRFVSA